MSANFDSYLVLLPDLHDNIDLGCKDPILVLALDEKDAVQKAVEKWWGSMTREGTAIVVLAEHATAYVLGEIRGVEIIAKSSLPDRASET